MQSLLMISPFHIPWAGVEESVAQKALDQAAKFVYIFINAFRWKKMDPGTQKLYLGSLGAIDAG